jgi:hypothetical protein
METNFDGKGEILIVVESFPGLLDHFADESVLLDQRGAHSLLDGPLLRTAAIELDSIAVREHKLSSGGEVTRLIRGELNNERTIELLGCELDVTGSRRAYERVRHNHGRVG